MAKGYYLIGFFNKGKKSFAHLQKQKPFRIDNKQGLIEPISIHLWEEKARKPKTYWANEWIWIEDNCSLDNPKELNSIYKNWCKKYKRKYEWQFKDK